MSLAWPLSLINVLTEILSIKKGHINSFTGNSTICSSLFRKQIILISLRNLSETILNSLQTGLNIILKIMLQPVGHTAKITLNFFTILNIFDTTKFHLIELAKIINLEIKRWRTFVSVTITAYEGSQGLKLVESLLFEKLFNLKI